MPDVSVIVPTHNRASMLREHLRALAAQTYPRGLTEWIVVCDGCTDDSASVARKAGVDTVIELDGQGPAAARNAGLAQATAALVCFLDDDIIPTPGWIQALLDDVRPGDRKILHIGYCPHASASIRSYLDRRNARWYESRIEQIRRNGYEPKWNDFFSGNFAANRHELLELGGFNPQFRINEDDEFGFRAFRSGWRIRFVPAARAEHYFHRDHRSYGRQAFMTGRFDALLVKLHPEAAPHVRIGIQRRIWKRPPGWIWRALALKSARSVDIVERLAGVGEKLRIWAPLAAIYPLIWDGNYWRGVAAADDEARRKCGVEAAA